MVTAQYLLEEHLYAMEQCGLLLQHALILYENRAYSSAVALATLLEKRWDVHVSYSSCAKMCRTEKQLLSKKLKLDVMITLRSKSMPNLA